MNGVLVVDKPEGPTSHDVVACVRRSLGERAVGHTGTLDPMATGVLVLVVGQATRLSQFLVSHEKTYEACIRLGTATDTWDRTGTVVKGGTGRACLPAAAEITAALNGFLGEQEQMPPPYSAKKVGGERAHVLARRGEAVAVRPARVVLHELEILRIEPPLVDIRLRGSAGFYVRALAAGAGVRLGCGACLERLRRTASGSFGLDLAISLDVVNQEPARAVSHVIPLERLLPELPAVVLSPAGAVRATHGRDVGPEDVADAAGESSDAWADAPAIRLLTLAGELLAVARPAATPRFLHPAVVLK